MGNTFKSYCPGHRSYLSQIVKCHRIKTGLSSDEEVITVYQTETRFEGREKRVINAIFSIEFISKYLIIKTDSWRLPVYSCRIAYIALAVLPARESYPWLRSGDPILRQTSEIAC